MIIAVSAPLDHRVGQDAAALRKGTHGDGLFPGGEPRKIITDKLRSYPVAHREVIPEAIRDCPCCHDIAAIRRHIVV
jgi:transposase-like protein